MSNINPIHTPCKKCEFAKYNENTQTDCHLNLIYKYKNKNTEILEVYDNDKEFYVINGKKCFGYRESSWFDKKNLGHLSLDEKIEYIQKHNFIQYLLVVDLKEFTTDQDLEMLKFQLCSLVIKPKKIILIRYQNDDKRHDFDNLKRLLEESNLGCKWRIQTVIEDKNYLDNLHESINLNKKYRLVCAVMGNKCDNLNNIITKANSLIYDELSHFEVLSNKNKNILMFSAPNYRYSLFIEKINILDTEERFIIV
jgi:hypothetical protein